MACLSARFLMTQHEPHYPAQARLFCLCSAKELILPKTAALRGVVEQHLIFSAMESGASGSMAEPYQIQIILKTAGWEHLRKQPFEETIQLHNTGSRSKITFHVKSTRKLGANYRQAVNSYCFNTSLQKGCERENTPKLH